MEGDDDLYVTARVLPENREVYETLLNMSLKKGLGTDEINSQLFNAGLVLWVAKVSEGLAEGPEGSNSEETDD
jgi:hypothetical protein